MPSEQERNVESDPTILAASDALEKILGGEPTTPGKLKTIDKEIQRDDVTRQNPAPEGEEADQAETSSEEQQSDEAAETEPQTSDEESLIELSTGDKVTLDDLKSGYLREADYTRKTQQLAEVRKSAEEKDSQRAKEWADRAQSLEAFFQFVAETDPVVSQAKGKDLTKLAAEDPGEYIKIKAQLEARAERFNEWQQTRAKIVQEEAARIQKDNYERLLEKRPELADKTKAKSQADALGKYLLDEGVTEQEIQSLTDHRLLIIAMKAMEYDRLQKAKPEQARKVVNLPKVQKPGTSAGKPSEATDKLKSNLQRLRKTGTLDDAASVFASML